MFECKISESAYQREIVRRLFDEPLTQQLQFVELQPGVPLFHVELAATDQPEQWRSLLFCELKEVWKFCRQEKLGVLGMSVRVLIGKTVQHELLRIQAVKTARSSCNDELEILVCDEGIEIVLCDGVVTNAEFKQAELIWTSNETWG